MAYEDLTDEEAYALAEYLGAEKVAELQAQVEQESEYEKLAEAQYELGQVMAHGFLDELEKQAGYLSGAADMAEEAARRGGRAASRFRSKGHASEFDCVGSAGRGMCHSSTQASVALSGQSGTSR